MIKRIVERVANALSTTEVRQPDPVQREHAIRMATAVLMVDVARADNEFDEKEFDLLLELIASHFELTADEAGELAVAADAEAEEMVEVYRFTQLLHEHLSEDEKSRVVALLWKVAYADGRLLRRLARAENQRFALRQSRTCHAPETRCEGSGGFVVARNTAIWLAPPKSGS